MKELTEKQIKYYESVALHLEGKLDKVGVREWQIEFDEDFFSTDVQKPGFMLCDIDHGMGDIDMEGNIELNNSNVFADDEPLDRFNPEELLVIGEFSKKLKNNEI
ncbi:hypothetical protein DY124_06215 [Apilactobacillus micheneri]|uniref:hypothetical protein n=1 Tax=Apilactobacillus micheneri TaxID=1899430 RepID=UPI00112B3130|nr:hypothetical protein [Apilactobacillus micheneri]TPR43168.1 hypothetical protein DY124_06215 [Apilactobacillus micheneri]TPR47256.1 hypothetical protein DY125_06710 [Apilactobacillus micheneri]